jgi:long-chain-fatty-acid--[acyl-carrier-protein] ligase
MLAVLRYALWLLARLTLALRYRVRVRGLEQVHNLRGPVLILPNHPGYIDPALILVALWPRLHPRPMLFEDNFLNPVLYPVMKLLSALRVPDLEKASAEARARARQAVAEAIETLRQGQNLILWPAGHIQHGIGWEALGGSRAAADILAAVPEAQVVLVRTRGVWGSSFSFARTGHRPPLGRVMWAGFGWLLANLVFFTPRRSVDVTIEAVDRRRLPEPRREVLNPWLENWFNADGVEPATFVPYHFLFGPRTYEFPKVAGLDEADLSQIKSETRTAVAQLLADKLGRPLTGDEQKAETTLDQLGLDSIDRMELTLAVEQRFGFSGDQLPASVGQLWALAQGLVEKEPPKPPPPAWFRPLSDGGALEIKGDTIGEAFVNRALACPRDVAVADDLAGVLSYERLLVAALALSRRLADLPSANVGLLLPASVACDTALMALFLADKLPVVLNWTTGPANLAHAAQTMGLTHVLTSHAFLDRTGVAVEGVSYLFLEDLRRKIGRWELLRTLLTVRLWPGRIRRRVPRPTPDRPAVVLFTSGSERAPKAVPLTHTNLLSDQRSGIPFLGLTRRESMLGFLPVFHSFGLAGNVLLPLLGGMRVVHHPNPTDAAGLAAKVAAYRPTMLVGTPTFVSFIVERARPEELASLRLIVVGAEACPPSLFERCARVAPEAHLLEGYGITECSPVVSVNRPQNNRHGSLGQALPGVEVCVTDLDQGAVLPPDQLGMLLVGGPTVFPGYLDYDGPSPFRELEGKRYFVTGDLVRIDADGYLWFGGRLKRFLKAGGEMISLPALEEPFARRYPPTADGPRVAVEGVEKVSGRRIVLFTTEPINLREANALLFEEGYRGVMRLDEVRRVDSIPVLGTGKTDYKVLRARLSHEEGASQDGQRDRPN